MTKGAGCLLETNTEAPPVPEARVEPTPRSHDATVAWFGESSLAT